MTVHELIPHPDVALTALHDAADQVDPRLLPCHNGDAELWFAESPADVEAAKALCQGRDARCDQDCGRRYPAASVMGNSFSDSFHDVSSASPGGVSPATTARTSSPYFPSLERPTPLTFRSASGVRGRYSATSCREASVNST